MQQSCNLSVQVYFSSVQHAGVTEMIKVAQNVIENDLLWRKEGSYRIWRLLFRPGEGYFKDIFPLNSAEIVTKKCKDDWLLKRSQPTNGKTRCTQLERCKKTLHADYWRNCRTVMVSSQCISFCVANLCQRIFTLE